MAYKAIRSEREAYGYFTPEEDIVLDAEGDVVSMGEEYVIEYDSYSEFEDFRPYYSEQTFYFTGKDGVERDFQNEREMRDWLKENGYTNDY